MRYKEFKFKNFKGIPDMALRLDGNVTTLIGLNESGKTTILEAIFCFSYGAEDLEAINPSIASLRDPERWIPISQRANFNEKIEITAVLELDAADIDDLKKYMQRNHGYRIKEIDETITITERHIFENSRHQNTRRLWNVTVKGMAGRQQAPRPLSSGSPQWRPFVDYLVARLPRIWYFPDFLFELPEKFELVDPDETVAEDVDKGRFYKDTFEEVLNKVGYGANLQTHVVERLSSSDKADYRSLRSVLLDMGRVITATIIDGWDRIFGRAPEAQEIELDADLDEDNGPYLELKIKGPDGYYDLSERSLGFRWFFMFLLMTSFRGGEESRQKPLFLLDEPASNLHPTAQAELLKSFEKLIDTCYLVYTTHSHHLINVRWLDAAYVIKNSALGSLDFGEYVSTRMGSRTSISATRYRRFVAEHPDQTSYFQPVLDLLDYRPSTLEPVPEVVLVEGKSDFYLLRYMAEVIGIANEIMTVPGTGAGSLDPAIRLHIGWGKTFLILLDGDPEGLKQAERYQKEFGPVLSDRCVLLPDVCGDSSVKEAEDLLGANDRERLMSRVFPADDQRPSPKRALRQAVIELYARKEAVSIDASTVDRFRQLFAALEERLDSLAP